MRRQKSLRIGVHHANAVVWEPVYRTNPLTIDRASSSSTFFLLRRRHVELRLADSDKENAPTSGNHTLTHLAACAKKKYVLRFGGDKAGSDMHLSHVKAIFGKFVREGKLTIEDKSNVKVLVKASPAECSRLMKTLTTLKGASPSSQHAYLASLTPCPKCASKLSATKEKLEERARKTAAAELERAEAELAKKRKREETERERE